MLMLLVAEIKILRVFLYIPLPLSSKYTESPLTFAYANPAFSSVVQSCPTLYNPMTVACQVSLSFTNSQSLLKLMSLESVMPSNHLILCYPLLLLPSVFPSIRVLSNESVLHIRWPKYWSFSSASVLPINIQDWFPLGWTGLISLQSKGLS